MAKASTTLLLLLSVLVSFLLCEGLVRGYAYTIALRGKLYQADPELGYTLRSNTRVRRRNAAGTTFTVKTNAAGYRVSARDGYSSGEENWQSGRRRVLIVGDSFAEGHVEFKDRFDQILARRSREIAIRTVGTGGYGTDQELLLAQRFFADLRPGDIFVLLTCGNDFQDILKDSIFGRTKPYFTLEEGQLRHHPPQYSFWYRLRDTSFLVGFVMQALDPYEISQESLTTGTELYKQLIHSFLTPLKQKGVRVIIAHHSAWLAGDPDWPTQDLSGLFRELADEGFEIIDLDASVPPNMGYHLQPDIHWNKRGNEKVAEVLARRLLN